MPPQTYTAVGEGRTERDAIVDFYRKAVRLAGKPDLRDDQIHIVTGRYREDGTYRATFYVNGKVNGTPTTAAPGADSSRLEKKLMDDPLNE